VAALSPTDVWSVGTNGRGPQERADAHGSTTPVIAHWDGRKLRMVRAFQPIVRVRPGVVSGELRGIAAVSPNDVWAVGTDGNEFSWLGGAGRPVILHWNGLHWRVVPTPSLHAPAWLSGITALSARNIWAVGQVGTRRLAEHWDGHRWRVTDTVGEGLRRDPQGRLCGPR